MPWSHHTIITCFHMDLPNQAEHREGQILMTEKISPSIPRQMLLRCLLLKRKMGKTHSKPSRSLKLLSRSVVSNSFATPWTVANQAPLSMGFSRQEYWSGLPYPPSRGYPDSGIELPSPALQVDFFLPLSHQGSPAFQECTTSSGMVRLQAQRASPRS